MSKLRIFSLSIFASIASTSSSFAFDFGRVRVPDYMDGWIVMALLATLAAFVALWIAKPRGMTFEEMKTKPMGPIATAYRYMFSAAFIVLMGLLFTGMFLQRKAEAEQRAEYQAPRSALSQIHDK